MTTYLGHTVDGNVDVSYPEPEMMHVKASLKATDGWEWKWEWEWYGKETSMPEISKNPDIIGVVNWLTKNDLEWQEKLSQKPGVIKGKEGGDYYEDGA